MNTARTRQVKARGMATMLAIVAAAAVFGPGEMIHAGTPRVPVCTVVNGVGVRTFSMNVPPGTKWLEVQTVGAVGATGDVSLYVRSPVGWAHGMPQAGNAERVFVADPARGTWMIVVGSPAPYTNVILAARYKIRKQHLEKGLLDGLLRAILDLLRSPQT